MNEKLNNLQAKTQDMLQTLLECLDNSNTLTEIESLKDRIDKLSVTINNLVNQTNELIRQNNEILNKISTLQSKEQTILTEQPNTIKEENKIEEGNSPLPMEESDTVISTQDKTTTKEDLPKQEPIIEQSTSAEMPMESTKEENKINLSLQENQTTTPSSNIEEEQSHKTSTVLEFLHKRVIKDDIKDNKSIPQDNNTHTIDNNSVSKTQPTEEQIDNKPPQSKIKDITEQIKSEAKRQNENKIRSIADQFEEKTNKDLFSAIGVSEKFMFINDLFSGNVKEYDSFVKNLNSATSYDDSIDIIQTMQTKKKWVKTSVAYTTLEKMITKRFE